MEKIILGVDPGTLIMGYGLIRIEEGCQPEMMLMDVLYMKRIADYNLRIRHIYDSMIRLIDTYHPDHLAIEAPFFGKNVQSMLKLGRAQGVAIAAAMSRDMSFTEYEPATIKQTITGNGNATKEQVHKMLQAQLGIELQPKYLDATDALAAAYTCWRITSNPYADIRAQLKPAKRKTSKKTTWADFLAQNPDRKL
ncbi:MAG: crossover junction endodeoxyribonuclease RuvC [Bacteroidales bacterium]|nr:crossover junction endodeoxyribonuclease RuvC [Bacteroidales bacterium]